MSGAQRKLPWTLASLLPPDTAWAPRTRPEALAWVALSRHAPDTVTGIALGFAGALPVVAHAAMVEPAARRLLEAGGLALPEDLRLYEREEEAQAAVRDLAQQGLRIAAPYPLPPGWVEESALLVAPSLVSRLNDKARLAEWVPPSLLPERVVLPLAELDRLEAVLPGEAVALKVATEQANGAAGDVVLCPSPSERRPALRRFETTGHPFHALVVERLEHFKTIWCAGFGLLADGVLWLGATRHLRGPSGLQAGSVLDADATLPDEIVEALVAIAEGWRRAGYRGPAGLDVGRTADGRYLVFDLNVRLNASTGQLLLHEAAARPTGAGASLSFFASTRQSPDYVATQALPWVRDGHLLVTRLANLARLPHPESAVTVNGLVLGEDQEDCEVIARAIQEALA